MAKSTRISLDSNVLIDFADGEERVVDAIETIRKRVSGSVFVVPPTVITELAYAIEMGQPTAALAEHSLRSIKTWGFLPFDLIPVGHGIVENTARKVLQGNLLPSAEFNDASILAESSLLSCAMLLTSDKHLLDINYSALTLLFRKCDLEAPVIISPFKVVQQFYPKNKRL